jgi:hypothetical protein
MTKKAPFCAFLWLSITVLIRQIRSLPAYQVILSSLPTYQVGLWSLPIFQLGPRNLRNPWLINDLRLRKITYEIINLFLQNEPNFQKVKLNVNNVLIREYEQMDTWSIRKNEPKTNPIEPKTNPILANKTPIRTQTNPKQTQFQWENYTVFTQKAVKRPEKSYIKPFFKKLQKFLRICLHIYTYGDILLHISEDIVLCN